MRNGPSCQRQRWSLPASACGSLKRTQMRKNSSFAGLLENAVKWKKTTYFYPKFLEFQIVYRGPQMTPSRAACGPRVWDPWSRVCTMLVVWLVDTGSGVDEVGGAGGLAANDCCRQPYWRTGHCHACHHSGLLPLRTHNGPPCLEFKDDTHRLWVQKLRDTKFLSQLQRILTDFQNSKLLCRRCHRLSQSYTVPDTRRADVNFIHSKDVISIEHE